MTWATLQAVRLATAVEFTPKLEALHHFVQLPTGRWCRTLGPPAGAAHVQGRIWRSTVTEA